MNIAAWERQIDETSAAYEAFQLYRDGGVKRSQKIVAETLGKNVRLISKWSTIHQWVYRAEEFDRHLNKLELDQLMAGRVSMRLRHATLGQHLQAIGAMRIQELINAGHAANLKPQELVAMVKVGAEIEALARGHEEADGAEPTVEINVFVVGEDEAPAAGSRDEFS